MNERISLVLRTKNITPSQLADELGVQRSGISHILNGRNKPSLDFIQRLIKKYPDISMTWLMFGEGPMMNPYPAKEESKPENIKTADLQVSIFDLFPPIDETVEENATHRELTEPEIDVNVVEKQEITASSIIDEQKVQKSQINTRESDIKSNLPGNFQNPIDTSLPKSTSGKKISRIVIFYSDRSFVDYFPGDD